MATNLKQPDFGRQRLERVLEIGAAGWFIFFLQYLYLGRPKTALLDLVVTLLIVRLRLNPSAGQRADKLLLYSALGLAAAALTSGQSRSLAVWYILALPLGAGFLSGIRSAWKWTAISSLLVIFVDLSEKFVVISPEFIPQGLELTAGRLALLFILLATTLAFRNTADSQVHSLHEQSIALEKARAKAEEANASRTRFLAVASHEFRTPMNSILGFSQLLLDETTGSLNPTEARYCQNLHASALKLHHLIQASLDFTLLEDEPPQLSPLKLWPMLRQLEEEFSSPAGERGVTLSWDIEPPELTVTADRQLLLQVLRQLLSNAVKFSEDGQVVRVVAVRETDGVVVKVTDQGPGIPSHLQKTIFEPLFQVDDSLHRTRGGLGLGLAIAKRCADRLGTELTLESPLAEGRGTAFKIRLLD